MTEEEALMHLGLSNDKPRELSEDDAMRTLGLSANGGTVSDEGAPTGSVSRGMKRKLSMQATGARQIGSNIGRILSGELGKPYSNYRLNANARARDLYDESANAPPLDTLGETLMGALEFAAAPTPEAILPRMGANAALGGLYEALEPGAGPMKIGSAALTNAVLPEGASTLAALLGGGYRVARGLANPRLAAAREAAIELQGKSSLLPKIAPSIGDRAIHVDIGPPTPEFARVPGVRPTVAMLTDDPALRILEQNARVRAGDMFKPRDIANQRAVYEALESRALPDYQAATLTDLLNERTGPLRNAALDAARGSPGFDAPLIAARDRMLNDPGSRAKRSSAQIGALIDSALAKTGASPIDPADLLAIRGDLKTMLENRAIAPDEMTAAVRSSRPQVMEQINAIDQGLNAASGGGFRKYLDEHSAGMKPIEEGRAFQDVLDSFERAPRLDTSGIPAITPAALRSAADRETYGLLTKQGYQDKLSPQGRLTLNDALKVLNRLEGARSGMVASAGSPTASYLASLARMGAPGGSGNILAQGISLAQALGRTRGSHALDRALLDPNELQSVLDAYHAMAESPQKRELFKVLERSLKALPMKAISSSGYEGDQ